MVAFSLAQFSYYPSPWRFCALEGRRVPRTTLSPSPDVRTLLY